MDARLAWARQYLKPPHGCEVRRLIAALTLAVGVPRLPIFAQTPTFDPLRFVSPWVYGGRRWGWRCWLRHTGGA